MEEEDREMDSEVEPDDDGVLFCQTEKHIYTCIERCTGQNICTSVLGSPATVSVGAGDSAATVAYISRRKRSY